MLGKLAVESRLQTCVIRVDNEEDAKELLKQYNTANRPLSKSQYKLYANEMLRGKWQLNGEPFIFGVDDSTGDESGISLQHRVHALIEAITVYNSTANPEVEYPNAQLYIEVAVVYNVPIETADTVDQGMLRKHGHVLYRDEWVATVIPKEWTNNNSRKAKWCNALAISARLVWLRAGGATVSSAPKFVVSEMLDFIKDDHKGLCDFVSSVLSSAEEDGAGLKISVPYIAGLCYIASLNDDGAVDKGIKDTILDAVLKVAQNNVTPGTAEHALVTYWNKLFSQPGGKDRDLDIVGPFVKALNAIISGEKATAAKITLTKKEVETYTTHPPLLLGWDEACFIYAAECKAEATANAERAKEQSIIARAEAKAGIDKEREDKRAAKAKADAAIKAETDAAKAKVGIKPGIMAALANTVKSKPKTPHAGISTKPAIKRRPVPAKN